jgi:hypothetical protein
LELGTPTGKEGPMKRTGAGNNRGWRVLLLVAMVAVGASTMTAQGAIISQNEKSLADMLVQVDDTPALGVMVSSIMSAPYLAADVYSSAYLNDNGMYVYLYQVHNTGGANYHPIELFTIWPFTDAATAPDIGFLNGNGPNGFLTGTCVAPELDGAVEGNLVTFYYSDRTDHAIYPGDHTRVMYIVSPLAPTVIIGNIIDGAVAAGPVVGPVPEPATMSLLAFGAGLLVLRLRRRR